MSYINVDLFVVDSPLVLVDAIILIIFAFRLGRSADPHAIHFMLTARVRSGCFASYWCGFRRHLIKQRQQ
jgi:hypothetical protein